MKSLPRYGWRGDMLARIRSLILGPIERGSKLNLKMAEGDQTGFGSDWSLYNTNRRETYGAGCVSNLHPSGEGASLDDFLLNSSRVQTAGVRRSHRTTRGATRSTPQLFPALPARSSALNASSKSEPDRFCGAWWRLPEPCRGAHQPTDQRRYCALAQPPMGFAVAAQFKPLVGCPRGSL
jgi:hypothetical protein